MRPCAAVALTALALALAEPARAQPAASDAQAQAEARYATGKAHYDLGEYAEAAEAFKEAYRLTGEPRLLFNIAQAERKREDCAAALTAYRSYLRNLPDAPNRAKVEEFIAEAEACVARQPVTSPAVTPPVDAARVDAAPVDAAPVDAAPVDAAPVDAAPVDAARVDAARVDAAPVDAPPVDAVPPRGGALRVAGVVSFGVGVVALGVGGYFARAASARADELDACQPCTPAQWQPIDRDGRAAQRDARIALALGGAGVVTGVVLYVLGARAATAEPPVTLAPTAGGVAVRATLAF
ncbi:MAG: hypothetical protein R3B06_18650 [Kofleriaceae bacterium]